MEAPRPPRPAPDPQRPRERWSRPREAAPKSFRRAHFCAHFAFVFGAKFLYMGFLIKKMKEKWMRTQTLVELIQKVSTKGIPIITIYRTSGHDEGDLKDVAACHVFLHGHVCLLVVNSVGVGNS